MNNNHLLVRAMEQSEDDFNIFFSNNVVAIGWSEVDFSKIQSIEELVKEVEKKYYSGGETIPQVVGKKKNEVRRFKGIKKGDKLLIPYWGAVCLAVAEAEELFSIEAYPNELANQRKVTYKRGIDGKIVFIPREKLTERLQRRMRVRGVAIADLEEFAEEIDRLFEGGDYNTNYDKKRLDNERKFKMDLLESIQSGKNNLTTGGRGLEILVKELLEIDGYDANIQSTQRFPGFADADIEAIKEDFPIPAKLFIQVKHHSGTTGTWGAQQLISILELGNDLFSEYRLVLITSGIPSYELKQLCENRDIKLIDGEDLVDWIFKSLSKLEFDTKRKLSIIDIPTLII